jgi:fumarate hydratase subunit beta
MDSYSPILIEHGQKGMIGKGKRNQEVKEACKKYKAVYFGATGGAGALIAKAIKEAEVIAYPELGPEAIRKLTVEEFPVTVINDTHGNDLYEMGRAKYEVKD